MAVTAQEYTQQIKQMLPQGLAWNADDDCIVHGFDVGVLGDGVLSH